MTPHYLLVNLLVFILLQAVTEMLRNTCMTYKTNTAVTNQFSTTNRKDFLEAKT